MIIFFPLPQLLPQLSAYLSLCSFSLFLEKNKKRSIYVGHLLLSIGLAMACAYIRTVMPLKKSDLLLRRLSILLSHARIFVCVEPVRVLCEHLCLSTLVCLENVVSLKLYA